MRVLWLSPWLRPLARLQAEALQRRGHEILLVTSDLHPESDTARDYEVVLDPFPKQWRTWAPTLRARRRIRGFGADVVITELVRDPRWMAFPGRVPRVNVVHDDRPHDAVERPPGWERALFARWSARSSATVTFSEYVAAAVRSHRTPPVHVVPLTSDVAEAAVPAVVLADARRDVVFVGRLNPYKNLDVTLAAWRIHERGPGWRGDVLVIIGDGDVPTDLPPHTRWIRGSYRYDDVVDTLCRAKASIVHYRRATQSGVQVMAMQMGVTPIVSPEGALPEYLPAGESPIGIDDVDGLAAAFDALADPASAAARGANARACYEAGFSADRAAAAWDDVLSGVVRPPH